jgi:hypothetical protein
MAIKLLASLIGLALMVTPLSAQEFADDVFPPPIRDEYAVSGGRCERAARQALAMTGGELLSVRPVRSGKPICAVTVLVINAKGRPKKVRLRIPMDF